ncbi:MULTISPECIES: hypothetical protein [unclassified Streptomyces]|uniref:hypothetical protein n=1 Tax=unclassified Streptomyces TaxID=2593676 RepID=UPI0024A98973|nr:MULTISPECIES: hypothetical protein [unclassified Streptomyces]
MERRAELPRSHRSAYDAISRGLDVPAKAAATDAAGTGSAPVRRALARRIQRDRFDGENWADRWTAPAFCRRFP